ncbi:MAG TPA: 3-deoxy-7-phosphoheptulonate synthase, partial [Firmicutes bacterium]|nr:3-deoxy-7-phosphoheptulonate synthase [Bacillota bacterium]
GILEDPAWLNTLPGVLKVMPVLHPYKLVSREVKEEDTLVRIRNVVIGGKEIVVMAGPCAVESEEQLLKTARAVKEKGAKILRGGAFKPRTSPYKFQGMAEEGLKLLREAAGETGLLIVTEVLTPSEVELVGRYSDILQIGARNMQNYPLLKEAGMSGKPVLLKRGMAASLEEWLMAAEYIMAEGNYDVILCERGIRTFETATRYTLDISAVPLVKRLSHLPVVVDPSHSAGDWRLVPSLSRAAVAAGADGLLIEVHPDPPRALCDGPQSLTPERFGSLMAELSPVAAAVGRALPGLAAQEKEQEKSAVKEVV